MTLNLQAKDSWIIFDDYGMALVKGDKLSWRDSLGRTVLAWIAYGEPQKLDDAIDSCLSFNFKENKWSLIRHPKYKEKSSRDHWSYAIIFYFLSEFPWFETTFVPDVPFMRGLYLWIHSLTGNKLAEFLYYLIYIPGALIGNIWLRICRWAGRIGPEHSNEDWIGHKPYAFALGPWVILARTKWQKLWAWIIFKTMPAYALHNKAWQIYVMPDSKRKERLKRILLRRVGKSNIMLRLLFGDKTVTQQEVDNYPHMTGYRPGVYLDETCRRTIRELTEQEAEFNAYEKDLIVWLFEQHKKEIFKRIHECTSKISNLTKGMLMFADAIVDTDKVFLKFKEAVSLFKST